MRHPTPWRFVATLQLILLPCCSPAGLGPAQAQGQTRPATVRLSDSAADQLRDLVVQPDRISFQIVQTGRHSLSGALPLGTLGPADLGPSDELQFVVLDTSVPTGQRQVFRVALQQDPRYRAGGTRANIPIMGTGTAGTARLGSVALTVRRGRLDFRVTAAYDSAFGARSAFLPLALQQGENLRVDFTIQCVATLLRPGREPTQVSAQYTLRLTGKTERKERVLRESGRV
ncbi:MAG: hypothetical protein FJX77_15690 [Armatimonadetes bacterium]|nr:hypothetical protein [Armatimonadota bacterium]